MGLFSIFKPRPGATPAAVRGDAAQPIEVARTRARRRLIGAVVLLGIGVIAFPLLFETQPRPIPVDIPIEIPRKENAAPLAIPAPRAAAMAASGPTPPAPVITETKAESGREVAAPVEAAPKPVAKPVPEPAAPAPSPKAAVPAPPTPEAKPAASEATGRFVVQIGAFADAAVARETRAKVEKLGLRTYTQSVDTDKGARIRVRLGPFATRDEADKAAEKVKAAGLPAAVLTL